MAKHNPETERPTNHFHCILERFISRPLTKFMSTLLLLLLSIEYHHYINRNMKVVSLLFVWWLLSSSIFVIAQEDNDNNTDTTTTEDESNSTTPIIVDRDGDGVLTKDDIPDDLKVWLSAKFKRGSGRVLDGSYMVKLSDAVQDMLNSTNTTTATTTIRATIQERIDQLLNESGIDITQIKIRHRMERVFSGFAWSEENHIIQNHTLRYEILKKLLNSSLVEYIEQDQILETKCTASWGLDRIDQKSLPMDGIYRHDWNGSSVDVYVLDTGVRDSHEQFEGRASCPISMIEGEDCTDGFGHGTHCSGTIGGKDYGVAKEVNIIGVKVLDNTGAGSNSGIISGIDWAVSQAQKTGRKSIISMSLGGPGSSSAMDQAIEQATNEGILVVVAAGNDNQNACLYQPASSQYALTVGSTDMNDVRSSFSNYGSCVQVFAPGSDITSAWYTSDNAVNTISGTSMATPHVAGIAALFWDQDPTLSVYEVMGKIITSDNQTTVQDAEGPDNRNGLAITAATFVAGRNTTPPPAQVCNYSSARSALFVASTSQTFILAVLPMLMMVATTFW